MPRKQWEPKNRYCKNTRLDEASFTTLVRLWLEGYSARKSAVAMADAEGIRSPEPKVTARYMRRFGYTLSELTIEREICLGFPGFAKLRRHDFGEYIEAIEMMARETVENALESYDYRIYRTLHGNTPFLETTGELELEIRHISALRRGIRPPYRGDLALAVFRLSVRASLAKDANEHEFRDEMVRLFLQALENDPMDISKNAW